MSATQDLSGVRAGVALAGHSPPVSNTSKMRGHLCFLLPPPVRLAFPSLHLSTPGSLTSDLSVGETAGTPLNSTSLFQVASLGFITYSFVLIVYVGRMGCPTLQYPT